MSQLNITLKLIFEDTLDYETEQDLREKFENHMEVLFDSDFFDRFGTIYDYEISTELDADDTA